MYLILMVYACLISCSLINKSKCHSLAYFNLRWTCVVILHKGNHFTLLHGYCQVTLVIYIYKNAYRHEICVYCSVYGVF